MEEESVDIRKIFLKEGRGSKCFESYVVNDVNRVHRTVTAIYVTRIHM